VFAQTTHVGVSNQTLAAYTEWLDFLPAAEYPDPPNFCHRRKSAGKMTARKRRRICKIRRATAKTSANLRLSSPFYQA